ncbi:MAG: ribonuclease HII [Candidatus Nealsonbacteria bacterium]|nr:ribonuclease HII [Candidatus Nealsonbacteria bacterium]
MPNLKEEKKLWTPTQLLSSHLQDSKQTSMSYKRVAGLDETGRGSLAGPVMAAAVMINQRTFLQRRNVLLNIKDSKQLTPKKREEFYKILTKNPKIEWQIARVSEKVIDKINILQATKLAMKKAVNRLKKKPNFLILDGKMKLDLKTPQKSIIKADTKVFSCAIASIIAKVTRDRIMQKYHKKYPLYGFDKHKGYLTKLHRKMLKKYGPCEIHRKSFRPIKDR